MNKAPMKQASARIKGGADKMPKPLVSKPSEPKVSNKNKGLLKAPKRTTP